NRPQNVKTRAAPRSSKHIARRMLYFGCALLALELALLSLLWIASPSLCMKLLSIIAASLTGGRLASILTGLELGFHPAIITAVLFLFNVAWLHMFFPVVIIFYHGLTGIKLFGKALESTRIRAEANRSRMEKYGIWGLPLFVWLPFPWTGALVGSVMGFLMGIDVKRVTIITTLSMAAGIVSWTFGFNYFLVLTGTWGKVISLLAMGMMLFSHVAYAHRRRGSGLSAANPFPRLNQTRPR
ncbi:small multi-drug export protein, partial [Elusimicrobiota bacterium]